MFFPVWWERWKKGAESLKLQWGAGATDDATAGDAVPYLGQAQFTHSEAAASGEPPLPVKDVMWGKVTGKSCSGTGTGPQAGQWTTGMGVPQYRCREISQSFSLLLVTSPPTPFLRAC